MCFYNESAEDALNAACKNNNMDVALSAINYLLYVQKPEPFIDVIKQVKNTNAT